MIEEMMIKIVRIALLMAYISILQPYSSKR